MIVPSLVLAFLGLWPGEVLVDEARGFQVELPANWSQHEQVTESGFVLTLVPNGTGRRDKGSKSAAGSAGVSITVLELEPGASSSSLFEQAEQTVRAGGAQYTDFETWHDRVDGHRVPGIRVTTESNGARYRLVVSYLVAEGRGYKIQRYAPVDDYKRLARRLQKAADSFELVPLSEEARAEAAIASLAARCGSEVQWARNWEEAARLAREEDRLVLVVAFLVSGFAVADTPKNSIFMNEDVIKLVNERYVPLWYTKGSASLDGAFKERYGLGGMAFGLGLLAATPEGELVLETSEATNADVAHPFLVEALERCPSASGPLLATPEDPVLYAEALLERGELRRAKELLDGKTSALAHRVRARLCRLERRGPEALAALALARAAGGEAPLELDVEEAYLRAREGELDVAARLLRGVIATAEDTALRAQAQLIFGAVQLARGESDQTAKLWRTLTEEQPETRWAWMAASGLQSPVLTMGLHPRMDWPDPIVLAEQLTFADPHESSTDGLESVVSQALDWLLDAQQPNGSWVGTTHDSSRLGMGADAFIDSYTALAGTALLRFETREGARAAAQRALRFVEQSIASRKTTPPLVFYMDYMTWSDSMMLSFLVEAKEAGLASRAELSRSVGALVQDLKERQQPNGGWSYYKTSDLEGADAPVQSISFTTAAAVLALELADDAGFKVPAPVLKGGVAALERMRNEEGVYSYFLHGDQAQGEVRADARGDVGHGPVCERALFENGKSSKPQLAESLAMFLQDSALYQAEQGKVLMHAGPQGQGCHYLLFDYTHSALVHGLSAADGKSRAVLLELILDCRQADGSFLDTPINGRAYGTAMALIAMDALRVSY